MWRVSEVVPHHPRLPAGSFGLGNLGHLALRRFWGARSAQGVPSEDGNEKEGEDTFEVKTEHVEAEDGHERVDDDAERCGHGVCSGRVEVALREMPDGWQPFYSSWDRALGCLKLVLRFDPSMQLPFGVDHVANPFFVMGSETVNDLLD